MYTIAYTGDTKTETERVVVQRVAEEQAARLEGIGCEGTVNVYFYRGRYGTLDFLITSTAPHASEIPAVLVATIALVRLA